MNALGRFAKPYGPGVGRFLAAFRPGRGAAEEARGQASRFLETVSMSGALLHLVGGGAGPLGVAPGRGA